jgi:hypothetical protein
MLHRGFLWTLQTAIRTRSFRQRGGSACQTRKLAVIPHRGLVFQKNSQCLNTLFRSQKIWCGTRLYTEEPKIIPVVMKDKDGQTKVIKSQVMPTSPHITVYRPQINTAFSLGIRTLTIFTLYEVVASFAGDIAHALTWKNLGVPEPCVLTPAVPLLSTQTTVGSVLNWALDAAGFADFLLVLQLGFEVLEDTLEMDSKTGNYVEMDLISFFKLFHAMLWFMLILLGIFVVNDMYLPLD